MHVATLVSNISSPLPGGKEYRFDIGQYTLVKGDNGAGKSGMISTPIRLALHGMADLNNKKDVKDRQALVEMAPFQGPGEMFAHVIFDDGGTAAWGLSRTAEGVVKAPLFEPRADIDPSTLFPLCAVQEALDGNDETARKAFLSWIGQATTVEDVLARVPTPLHAKFKDIYDAQQGSPADRFLAVSEYAKKRAAEIEADATSQDSLIAQLTTNLTAATGTTPSQHPTGEDLARAKLDVETWQNAFAAAVTWDSYRSLVRSLPTGGEGSGGLDVPKILQDRETAISALDAAEGNVHAWEAAVADRRGAVAAEEAATSAARHAYALLSEDACASGQCPACGSAPGTDALRSWAAYHAAQVHSISGASAAALREAETAKAGWEKEADRLRGSLAKLDGMLEAASSPGGGGSAPQPPGVPDPGITVQQAQDGLAQRQEALTKAERAAGAEQALQQARDAATALRASKPAYVDLHTHCQVGVEDILKKNVEEFSTKVQKRLPERYRFGVEVKNGFRVGLVTPSGVIRTILSGAELDALQVAITMAVVEMGGGAPVKGKKGKGAQATRTTATTRFSIVIPADVDRTPETLAEVMRAWRGFPGQVIIESTKLPAGRFPKDWTLVDLDEWREKNVPALAPEGEKAGTTTTPPTPSEEQPTEQPAPKGQENGQAATPSTLPPPPPTPPTQGALGPARKWYYHEGSDSYARLTDEEYQVRPEELVEIDGTDDGAPDRHRAGQDDPNTPPTTTPSDTPVGVSGGGNATPPADVSDVSDAAFKAKGLLYRANVLANLGPKTRARLLADGVQGARVLLAKNNLTVFDQKGATRYVVENASE